MKILGILTIIGIISIIATIYAIMYILCRNKDGCKDCTEHNCACFGKE